MKNAQPTIDDILRYLKGLYLNKFATFIKTRECFLFPWSRVVDRIDLLLTTEERGIYSFRKPKLCGLSIFLINSFMAGKAEVSSILFVVKIRRRCIIFINTSEHLVGT